MTREEQLEWEARWGLPAAISAFVAGALLLVSGLLFIPEDRKGIEPNPDILLSIHEQSGAYLTSAVLAAIASVVLIGVFLYLFRAAIARGAAVPQWFIYLVVGGPLLYAVATVLGALDAIDIGDEFASGTPIRGQAGEDRARDLGGSSGLLVGISTAGTVGMAFLFVMLPLRARRVGLLTPFMGILGVVAGALIVFRGQLPGLATVLQAFWLGALGALLLGRWPGGRGPGVGERQGRALADGRAAPRTSSDAWRGAGADARPHAARAGTGAAATEVAQAAPQALAQPGARRGPPASNEHEHDEPHGGGREDHELITGSLPRGARRRAGRAGSR